LFSFVEADACPRKAFHGDNRPGNAPFARRVSRTGPDFAGRALLSFLAFARRESPRPGSGVSQ
jgi:hypothetical protein